MTNYIYHRAGITELFLARLQLASLQFRLPLYTGINFDKMWSICHGIGSASQGHNSFFFTEDTAGSNVHEVRCDDTGVLGSGLVVNYGGGGVVTVDSDHENNKTDYHRIVVVDDGAAADEVYYTNALIPAYAKITFTAGAPAYDWRAVGCDQNNAVWLIGSAGIGGGPTSYVWRSTDGVNFANVATWPGATVAEDIQFIKHSNHNAGDLGPNDPGNPAWLAVSATYAYTSSDGITWNGAAHGLGVTPHARSITYSKTSGRWIWPLSGTGNVAYSEDNGLNWSTWAGVTPALTWNSCKSNGYGTIIANIPTALSLICSVDDGENWYVISPENVSTLAAAPQLYYMVHCVFDQSLKAYEQSTVDEYFVAGGVDNGAAPDEFEFSRSLRI